MRSRYFEIFHKEFVFIGLYKKNIAVSCVGFDFVLYQALYTAKTNISAISGKDASLNWHHLTWHPGMQHIV